MDSVVKAVNRFGDWLGVIAGILLVAIMTLIVVNIILRQVASPYGGTAEVVGYLAALCAGLLSAVFAEEESAHRHRHPHEPLRQASARGSHGGHEPDRRGGLQHGHLADRRPSHGHAEERDALEYSSDRATTRSSGSVAICFGLFTLRILLDVVTGFRDAFRAEVKA